MPDVHAGKGCVIGFTADLGDKVIPNIVGVDIGCGMLCVKLGNIELDTYHDHRLAMTYYIAGLLCNKEICINNFEWVNISFPEFESLINKLSR